jgi:hypothetical protein
VARIRLVGCLTTLSLSRYSGGIEEGILLWSLQEGSNWNTGNGLGRGGII